MAATMELKEVFEQSKKTAEGLATLTKSFNGLVEKMKTTPAGANGSSVFGLPNIRTGEDPMTSRGYSFLKMLGVVAGHLTDDEAKVEVKEVHDKLHKAYSKGMEGYTYSHNNTKGRWLAPLASSFLHENYVPREDRLLMKSLINAGMDGADLDEMSWMRKKSLQAQGYSQKSLSWLNELSGGALVAPPQMGELIELLRNKEALVNAGARTVPLPPQGRLKYPKQTMASTTYWVGENRPITDSEIGTGEITLQARKLAVLIKAPNELIRFASPAAEALIRDDMTKSLALGLDLACLEGVGSDTVPRGVITMPNINRVESSAPGADGDRLVGEDIYRMVAAIEESNAEFEGWIMRPKTWFKYLQLRADAVAQGDRQGMFLFNAIREPGELAKPSLATYPVTKSTQVSQSRSKGASSNLTYILGGMFSDILIGMFGAIEFAATQLGDTPFTADQTWVRGILSADCQVRHEASLVLMDNLSTTL